MDIPDQDNPNAFDSIPQVRSPRSTTMRSRAVEPSGQVVNGVDPPLRGHLDMDGEVSTAGMTREQGVMIPPASFPVPRAGSQEESQGAPSDLPIRQASDFLQGPRGQRAVETELGRRHEAPSGMTGMAAGMSNTDQAAPLVHGPPAGSGQSAVRTSNGVPTMGDSVEYASVTSSAARWDGARLASSEPMVPGMSLLGPETVRRLQQMQVSAPHLYGLQGDPTPPRPPSTSSSDIQMEVRRQLGDLRALHEEESRRLRAQVEALVAENYELRMTIPDNEQGGRANSRSWLVNQGGFPGLGWLGRGLGSILGNYNPPPPPRALESTAPAPPRQAPPSIVDLEPVDLRLRELMSTSTTSGVATGPMDFRPLPPPPPPPLPCDRGQEVYPVHRGDDAAIINQHPVPKPCGLGPRVPVLAEDDEGSSRQLLSAMPDLHSELPTNPDPTHDDLTNKGSEASLDPLKVVLTGMAQLQGLVTELAGSPKAPGKPEVIKPGVSSLTELPLPGPEASLHFADWLHDSKPALSDISDNSEVLWQLVLDESEAWYKKYLQLGPMERLVSKPSPSPELADPKWSRLSRRIEGMILSSAPQTVRQEISSARVSGLLNVMCRLFCIYGPGGLAERELGLRNIQDPPTSSSIQEAIDQLRRWRRWCNRMSELGGALPDCALRVKALTKMTRQVLQGQPEIAFRISLVRAELQVDLTPTDSKVDKLHAQLLSEFEAVNNRKDKDSERDKTGGTAPFPATPKIKGVDAPEPATSPKAPKPPKANPKTPPPPKVGGSSEGQGTARTPCSFYTTPNGCKKGLECSFEHDWNQIPSNERSQRCKSCGAKGHKAAECKAGSKEGGSKGGKAKGGGKGPNAGRVDPASASVPPPPPVPSGESQQIKSMLADAALLLQQAMPKNTQVPDAPVQAVPKTAAGGTQTSAGNVAQGTPVTLASLSAQLETLRSMSREFGVRTVRVCARANGSPSSPLGQRCNPRRHSI